MKLELIVNVPEGCNNPAQVQLYNASEGLSIVKKQEGHVRWLVILEVPGNHGAENEELCVAAAKVGKYRINHVVGPAQP